MVFVLVAALAACGGSGGTHYRVNAALDCLERTDARSATRSPWPGRGIDVIFASDDDVSAVESVLVVFLPESEAKKLVDPSVQWSEQRGDAVIASLGPYERP